MRFFSNAISWLSLFAFVALATSYISTGHIDSQNLIFLVATGASAVGFIGTKIKDALHRKKQVGTLSADMQVAVSKKPWTMPPELNQKLPRNVESNSILQNSLVLMGVFLLPVILMSPFAGIGVFLPIAVILVAMFTFIFISSGYSKEKHLLKLGTATAATIVGEREYLTGRALRLSLALTYEFVDAEGKTIQGIRTSLPIRSDQRNTCRALLAKITDNPTVLYDPENSRKNILYPPVYGRVSRRE